MGIGIGLVGAGMADVEGAVACVVTGIKREVLRCVVFGPEGPGEAMYSNNLPVVITSCNILVCSLQGKGVEKQLVFERSLLLRWLLSSRSDREILFTQSRNASCKTVDPNTGKTQTDHFG